MRNKWYKKWIGTAVAAALFVSSVPMSYAYAANQTDLTGIQSAKESKQSSLEWPQHYGATDNNAVVNSTTAIQNGELAWSLEGRTNLFGKYAGHPVLVNGNLYVARAEKLEVIDSQTGVIKQSADLAKKTGFYSYITYGDGKIFVPLTNGQIQCFDAVTLESLFITEEPTSSLQGLSCAYYSDGMVYTGLSTSSGSQGYFAAYSAEDKNTTDTMEIVPPTWTVDTGKGYYGSGAVVVNQGRHLVFVGDAGIITAVDAKTGTECSRLTLDGGARGAVVSAEGYLWTMTKSLTWGETSGNQLYKLSIDEKGVLLMVAKSALPEGTNCSPVVADGKVIATGGSFSKGFIQVYDLNLNLLSETTTTAEVKSPTATTAYDDLYLYFAQNAKPGGVYVAKIGADNQVEVELLHEPEQKQYSMSNVVVGKDGMLYYANDSGYLFAVKGEKVEPTPEPTPDPEPTPTPDPEPTPTPDPEPTPTPDPEPTPTPNPTPDSTSSTQSNANGDKQTSAVGNTEKKQQNKSDSNIKNVLSEQKKSTSIDLETQKNDQEKDTDVQAQIIEAIQNQNREGKNSLTVKHAPDVIAPEVFAELQKYPEFTLIFDQGTYTISIQGKDVLRKTASLSTIIEKINPTVAEKWLGIFEQYRFTQDGALPGKITVVYRLPEVLAALDTLHFYDAKTLREEELVLEEGYAMFSLEKSGEFLLAEGTKEVQKVNADVDKKEVQLDEQNGSNTVVWIIACVAAVALVCVVVTTAVLRKRRKRKTWAYREDHEEDYEE